MELPKIEWPYDPTSEFANFANQFARDEQGQPLQGDALHNYEDMAQRVLKTVCALLQERERLTWLIGEQLHRLRQTGISTEAFHGFVQGAFRFSPRKAAHCMNVYKAWETLEDVPDLPQTKLYEEAQRRITEEKRKRRKGQRRWKPSSTIPTLAQVTKRLETMKKHPNRVIPKTAHERGLVQNQLFKLQQQCREVLEDVYRIRFNAPPPGWRDGLWESLRRKVEAEAMLGPDENDDNPPEPVCEAEREDPPEPVALDYEAEDPPEPLGYWYPEIEGIPEEDPTCDQDGEPDSKEDEPVPLNASHS